MFNLNSFSQCLHSIIKGTVKEKKKKDESEKTKTKKARPTGAVASTMKRSTVRQG